jgi:hypothetical protein
MDGSNQSRIDPQCFNLNSSFFDAGLTWPKMTELVDRFSIALWGRCEGVLSTGRSVLTYRNGRSTPEAEGMTRIITTRREGTVSSNALCSILEEGMSHLGKTIHPQRRNTLSFAPSLSGCRSFPLDRLLVPSLPFPSHLPSLAAIPSFSPD